MTTKTRKNREIKKVFSETSSSDSKILQIKSFYIYSRYEPELYQEYITRKDIKVDFSSAKTPKDIKALYENFIKKFKDAPTKEQIDKAQKEYDLANKNMHDSFMIQNISRQITADLANVGSDKRISDERYANIIEYTKETIRALADGKNIDSVKEGNVSFVKRFLNKLIGDEPLRYTK